MTLFVSISANLKDKWVPKEDNSCIVIFTKIVLVSVLNSNIWQSSSVHLELIFFSIQYLIAMLDSVKIVDVSGK